MCGIACVVKLPGGGIGVNGTSFDATGVSGAGPGLNGTSGGDSGHRDGTDEKGQLEAELRAALSLIAHRGPDAEGVWISEDTRVGLAHCRLSINDLGPSATQPLHAPCGTVHVVVNGEIYDFDRLRRELADEFGYVFQTASDSEVVLALYMRHGLDFVEHLRGEFAICIYDEAKQTFLAVRDRYGIKPLFWTVSGGRLLIAAEAKALLGLGWRAEWDVSSLVEGGWPFGDTTLFRGVKKLRPGHILTCDRNGSIDTKPYWDISYPDKRRVETRSEEEMILEVREAMVEAVRLRLRADVPVGIYLSGGVDSSALAGIAAHLVREQGASMGSNGAADRICCFNIAFDKESGFDESEIAERTAKWLDFRFIKKHMTEEAIATRFEDATWHCEHHNFDLNFVGKFALSEAPREIGFKVVLTGEGADEQFAGYPVFLPDFLQEPDHSWPQTNLPDEVREQKHSQMRDTVKRAFHTAGGFRGGDDSSESSPMLNGISTPSSICMFEFDLYAEWARRQNETDARKTILKNTSEQVRRLIQDSWHPLHSAQFVWSRAILANNFLTCLGDRTEMSHSIEARPPFLDHKLTECANGLPPSMKIRYNPESGSFIEKWILKEAARPFITDELYARQKHPYIAPIQWPKDGPLQALFTRLITESNIKKLGFIDWREMENVVRDAFEGQSAKAMRTAIVLSQFIVLSQRFNIPAACI